MTCVVCFGPIRERRHPPLGGARAQQEMTCSLWHCKECRTANPTGRFYLCELCARSKLGTFKINTQALSEASYRFAVQLACRNYVNWPMVCLHNEWVRNDLVDTLFLLIKPKELIAGAAVFLDFYLNGTWHELFAPPRIQEVFQSGQSDEMWSAFYQTFIQNSQCPRVRMICYAVQCALDTGPVMRHRGSRLQQCNREVFLSGDLRSNYNKHGLQQCIVPRVLKAAEYANGLFSPEILKVMAIRIFKLLGQPKFNASHACCCSSNEGDDKSATYIVLHCRGPVLDLSCDPGQPHLWHGSCTSFNSLASICRRTIRQHQSELRNEIECRDFNFDATKHYALPGLDM